MYGDGQPVFLSSLTPDRDNLSSLVRKGEVSTAIRLYRATIKRVSSRMSRDSVRNFVKKLRAKLADDAAKSAWILNERGVGYRMPAPDER